MNENVKSRSMLYIYNNVNKYVMYLCQVGNSTKCLPFSAPFLCSTTRWSFLFIQGFNLSFGYHSSLEKGLDSDTIYNTLFVYPSVHHQLIRPLFEAHIVPWCKSLFKQVAIRARCRKVKQNQGKNCILK